MKTSKRFRCFVAVMFVCVFAVASRGETEANANLGLERWATFEATLKQYRSLLNSGSGSNSNEDTRREIDEYIEADSKAQIESLRRFYSGRLMLFVTRTTKDSPGLPESELAGMIASRITELEMALWGAHKDLPSESTLRDKVEVSIQSAGETKKLFQSWRIGGGSANSFEESNKENKSEQATPSKPSD